jgi:hypothetical protein
MAGALAVVPGITATLAGFWLSFRAVGLLLYAGVGARRRISGSHWREAAGAAAITLDSFR